MRRGFGLWALAALLFVCLGPSAAEARWLRAESPRFIVYGDGDERTVRDYAIKLEDFDTVMRLHFGMDPNGVPARKLEVYLVGNRASLRRVRPDATDSLAGFYSSSRQGLFAIALNDRAERRDEAGDDYTLHEYAHHFMLQSLPGTYPGWLIEGFAEYFMTARLDATSFEVGTPNASRAYTLSSSRWTPTTTVLTKGTGQLQGDQVLAYYAQAWLMTHYMLADPVRRKQLFAYVRAVGEGENSVAAWTKVTGQSIEDFDRDLRRYMRGRVMSTRFKRRTYTAAEVQITALPDSADDLLLESLRLNQVSPGESDAAFLADLRARAGRHLGDRFATLTLARGEVLLGDRAAGATMLDTLIAADANDADALRIRAEALLADGQDAEDPEVGRLAYNKAAKLLLRANKAVPDDYRTLFDYARSRTIERDYPSDNALEVLMAATTLAPQVSDIRIETGRGLIRRKRYDEAIDLLRGLANSPHGGTAAQVAQDLIQQIASVRSVPGAP